MNTFFLSFFLSWVLMCFFRWSFLPKRLPQAVQACGLTPVCMNLCLVSSSLRVKALLQFGCAHLNGLSPVCILTWFTSWPLFEKAIVHVWHWKIFGLYLRGGWVVGLMGDWAVVLLSFGTCCWLFAAASVGCLVRWTLTVEQLDWDRFLLEVLEPSPMIVSMEKSVRVFGLVVNEVILDMADNQLQSELKGVQLESNGWKRPIDR